MTSWSFSTATIRCSTTISCRVISGTTWRASSESRVGTGTGRPSSRLRAELGYVDYLGALQRYRLDELSDPRVLLLSSFLVDYPFASRLYARALDAIRHLRTWGLTVILRMAM
jgi:hypothetical protein